MTSLISSTAELLRDVDRQATELAVKQIVKENSDRLDKLEARNDRMSDPGQGRPYRKTLGASFIEAKGLEGMQRDGVIQRNASVKIATGLSVKAIVNDASATGLGYPNQPERLQGIAVTPQQSLRLLNIVPIVPVKTDVVEWVSENIFTNNAAPQYEASPERFEGVAKAQSGITFSKSSVQVATVAHYTKASKQLLSDAPQLQTYIDGRLQYGLRYVIEDMILNGAGTSGEFNGLLSQVSAAGNLGSNETTPDIISNVVAQLDAAGYMASGILMSPTQWHLVRTLKDTAGRYIFGDPNAPGAPNMWGVPVVQVQQMSAGTILIGDFQAGCALLEREPISVQVGFENDDFTKNLVTLLAEGRYAFQMRLAAAFRKFTV